MDGEPSHNKSPPTFPHHSFPPAQPSASFGFSWKKPLESSAPLLPQSNKQLNSLHFLRIFSVGWQEPLVAIPSSMGHL